MHDAEHGDTRHPRLDLAALQRRKPDVASQQEARAHPRGRVWWTLPPILRTGPWRRIRAPDEDENPASSVQRGGGYCSSSNNAS